MKMTPDNGVNNPIAITIVRGLLLIALIVVVGAIFGPWVGKPPPSEGVLDIAQQIVAAAVGMLAKTTIDRVRDQLGQSDADAAPVPVEVTNTTANPAQTEVVAPPALVEAAEDSVRPPDLEEVPEWPEGDPAPAEVQ